MFSGAHRSIGFVSVFQNRFPLTLISRRASQIGVRRIGVSLSATNTFPIDSKRKTCSSGLELVRSARALATGVFFFCTKRSQAYRPREAFHATSFTVTTSRLRSIFEPPLLHRRRASERGTSLAPSRGLTAVEAIPKAAQRARRSGPVEETPMTTTTLVAHAGSRCCCSTKSTDNRKNEPEKASATTARWTNR